MKYGKGKTKTAGKKAVGIRRQLRRVFGLLIGFLIIVEVASFVLVNQLSGTYEDLLGYKRHTTEQPYQRNWRHSLSLLQHLAPQ